MKDGDIYIEVKAYGGAHIADAIKQMVALANKAKVDVWAELNGVRTLARPFDAPSDIYAAWCRSIDTKQSHASA